MDADEEPLLVTRLVLRTLVAVDLGWITEDTTSSAFLRDRGRPGWMQVVEKKFKRGDFGFLRPVIRSPEYGKSQEHGRPTFSDEFAGSYMPIVVEPASREIRDAGSLWWYVEWMKIGPTGAISLCARAELPENAPTATALEIVRAYHVFRLELRRCWPELFSLFRKYWSEALPEYALDENKADTLADHLEFYDVVDFDFLVYGEPMDPKTLYRTGPTDALRAFAGLTRMSHVMGTYSEDTVRGLGSFDLGNRPDELWIVNVERLTRHHPEHLTDIGKRLFMEDIVSGIEILLQQRATLNYVIDWVRNTRATFLDRLTDDSDVEPNHSAMRTLLKEMAWTSDLFSETISVDRDSGSSFFRSVISMLAQLKEVDQRRAEVAASVDSLLNISEAVFGERSAAASARLDAIGLSFERSSRNLTIAAVVFAAATVLVAVVQILITVFPSDPSTPAPKPGPTITVTESPSRSVGHHQSRRPSTSG